MTCCANNRYLAFQSVYYRESPNPVLRGLCEFACDTLLAFLSFSAPEQFLNEEPPQNFLYIGAIGLLLVAYTVDTFGRRFTNRLHGFNTKREYGLDDAEDNLSMYSAWGGDCCCLDRDFMTLAINFFVGAGLGVTLALTKPSNTISMTVTVAEALFALAFNAIRSTQNHNTMQRERNKLIVKEASNVDLPKSLSELKRLSP